MIDQIAAFVVQSLNFLLARCPQVVGSTLPTPKGTRTPVPPPLRDGIVRPLRSRLGVAPDDRTADNKYNIRRREGIQLFVYGSEN